MTERTLVALRGDGIGEEVVNATLRVHEKVVPHIRHIEFEYGEKTGGKLTDQIVDAVEQHKLILKGPTATPQGDGYPSPARLIRSTFDLFANVRPARPLPNVPGPFGHLLPIDIVIVRENSGTDYGIVEQEYAGGAKVTADFLDSDCDRIAEFAFRFAEENHRQHVHVGHKSNIYKITHGKFKAAAYAAQKRHTSISCRDFILDNLAMQLMRNPVQFDLILMTNLFGDIFSDLIAGMVHGSLGFAGSLNAGNEVLMAEAVHGTAPDIVGRGVANPAALMFSECLLLDHIGERIPANRWRTAIKRTLLDKILTKDVDREKGVGTKEWTDAVIARL